MLIIMSLSYYNCSYVLLFLIACFMHFSNNNNARESNFLFQQLSVALQRGECGLISKHVHRCAASSVELVSWLGVVQYEAVTINQQA